MPSILIAEDNQGTAEMLKFLLELEGFEASIVQRAPLVLASLEQQLPDVLLLDFHLGREESTDLLRTIRSQADFNDLPIVVVSGTECGWEVERAGADIFLLKPFGVDALLAALREAMARRQTC